MPARLRHRIDTLQVTAVRPPTARAHPQADSGVLVTLSAAVHAREVLRFDYAAVSAPDTDADGGPPPPRRTEPHHLVTWGGRWYLVAWDLGREDWRIFRVDRITPRTPRAPLHPARTARRRRGHLRRRPLPWLRRLGRLALPGEVLLDLPAAVVSRHVSDGVVEALGPDRCRLLLGSWSWPGLAAALGRFDADIEVIGPAELRDAFGQLARRYAKAAAPPSLRPRPHPRLRPRPHPRRQPAGRTAHDVRRHDRLPLPRRPAVHRPTVHRPEARGR
ncbi:WYL domain-containing protein [Streptomyces sp. M19]